MQSNFPNTITFSFKGEILAIRTKNKREVALMGKKKIHLLSELESTEQIYQEKLEYLDLEKNSLLLQIEHAEKINQADSILLEKRLIPELEAESKKLNVPSLKSQLQKLKYERIQAEELFQSKIRSVHLEIAKIENEIIKLKNKINIRSLYTGIVKDISFSHSHKKLSARIELEKIHVNR